MQTVCHAVCLQSSVVAGSLPQPSSECAQTHTSECLPLILPGKKCSAWQRHLWDALVGPPGKVRGLKTENARKIQLLPKSGRPCLLEGFCFCFSRISSYLTKLEYMVSNVHYEAMYDALSITSIDHNPKHSLHIFSKHLWPCVWSYV